ncbi:sporulation protein [Bacillus sp. M6-12]|uniref:YhcN/YlaJ family sporulation lipoprotein n=1 Tax=Bacillus sp. M6-12 TaxID=2054166 RepID=UPI000C7902D8|nr:YhcN/YlaJ family sporulation lipoprotein [Bacillus sp. M6-12]PLS18083.1 sporulation protein [Bacillus sp. M6-12]
MKKSFLTLGLCSIFALSACNFNAGGNGDRNSFNDTTSPSRVNNPTRVYDEDYRDRNNNKDDFGYTRTDNATINGRNLGSEEIPSIDREQLSDIITRLNLQVPNIKDVATLVTDEEVLVVYGTDSKNRSETADQVKRTAISVVPRYYHVYVSDNKALMPDIENFATLDSKSRGTDESIEATIREMLKSPQGRKLSNGENANGEMENETTGNADEDDNISQKVKEIKNQR